MIEFRELLIQKIEDYDQLFDYVGGEAIDVQAVATKKISGY